MTEFSAQMKIIVCPHNCQPAMNQHLRIPHSLKPPLFRSTHMGHELFACARRNCPICPNRNQCRAHSEEHAGTVRIVRSHSVEQLLYSSDYLVLTGCRAGKQERTS